MNETPKKKPAPRAKKKTPEPTPGMVTPTPPAPPAPPAPPESPQPSYVSPAQQVAPMLESTARNYAMWAHLSALLTWFIGIPGIAGALTFWLIGKDRSALVDHNGKESVNFQLTILVILAGGTVLGIVTFAFGFLLIAPLWFVGSIIALIFQIQASAAANRGEYYRYPISWRMVR